MDFCRFWSTVVDFLSLSCRLLEVPEVVLEVLEVVLKVLEVFLEVSDIDK